MTSGQRPLVTIATSESQPAIFTGVVEECTDHHRLENWTPYFQNSITFTGPNDDIRFSNVTTVWDDSAFTANGGTGPVQVTYTNYVSAFATWLEKALDSLGMERTAGFANGKLLGYHYAQATIRNEDQTRSSSASYIHKTMAGNGVAKKKLKVFTQTLAKQILFDGKKATGECWVLFSYS